MNNLGLIVLDNCKEIGQEIDECLKRTYEVERSFIIPIEQPRFRNGESKIIINESVRAKNIFIISDVGNHSCTYQLFDHINHLDPDNHFQDIKRAISACCGNPENITLITPLLYASRQHKRKSRESLDCPVALQEIERLGVKTIVTFDAHDPNVQSAIPNLSFENFYPTHIMLTNFVENEKVNIRDLLVISPDTGAADRARFHADMLKTDVGMFYKRRDLTTIVDGKNPVVAHEYMGKDVKNKDIIVVDDMIASGGSVLEVAEELKKKGANKIYISCTFALFTEGIKKFDEAHQKGIIEKIYTTNLSYIPDTVKEKEWIKIVNCSPLIANIIHTLHQQMPLSPLLKKKELIKKR